MRKIARWAGVTMVTSALVMGGAGIAQAAPPSANPTPTVAPAVAPTAAKVVNTFWYSDRRVAIWVYSPAMNKNIQVQLLLARDWNYQPAEKFPELLTLDGLRAQNNQSGWILNTDVEKFYRDKNVNVVMPVGGAASYYTDWQQPDKGVHYMWETFLTKELPSVLESQWRTSTVRGVQGLSMGGTAAFMLAARNPGFFKFAASYSGYPLQLTTFGMPQAIQFAMKDAGGWDSNKMFGGPDDPDWKAHDPYVLADKLRGTSLYISSGNGMVGPLDTPNTTIPEIASNPAGSGLELISRVTSQQMATKLNQLGIPAQAVYRASGTHTWGYWQFEMHQSWPQAAFALGLGADKVTCKAQGAIAAKAKAVKSLGDCVTPEYDVPSGKAQDFDGGRILWSPGTGAHVVAGAVGGAYIAAGGPAGWLGLPIGDEGPARAKNSRQTRFQHGTVYWSQSTGAHAVAGAIADAWNKAGGSTGALGLPTGDEVRTANGRGRVQGFQIGAYYWAPDTGAHSVQGKIGDKYASLGAESGVAGFPVEDERNLRGGKLSVFENGLIYWTPKTGAHYLPRGAILDAWGKAGYENGRLGYPTSDVTTIPGGTKVTFQKGSISQVNGKISVNS